MALSGKATISVRFTETGVGDLGTPSVVHELASAFTLTSGTGANQADRIFSDDRQIAASGSEDLDLAGSLAALLGGTVTLVELIGLFFLAAATNTNLVNITRSASNGVPGPFLAAGDGLSLRPGAAFGWLSPDATGIVVTPGTGDLITVANSGAGSVVNYKVIAIGRSA